MINKKSVVLIFLGVGFLFLFYNIIDINIMLNLIKVGEVKYIIMSSIIYILVYILRSFRWNLLLNRVVESISAISVYYIYMAGLVINYIIPVRLGELAKSVFLKKNNNIPIAISMPTILIDKMLDLFPVVFLMILIPWLPEEKPFIIGIILYTLSIIFLGGLIFFIVAVRNIMIFKRFTLFLAKIFSRKYIDKIDKFLDKFIVTINLIVAIDSKYLIKIISLSIIIILLDGLYLWLAFIAFSKSISFYYVVIGYTLLNLTYILPTPPAQLGSNEILSLIIFHNFLGIEKNLVGTVLTITHIITASIIIIIGYLSLNIIGIKLNTIKEYVNDRGEKASDKD